MALLPDRNTVEEDISFFMNETATRGGVVVISTAASGAAMDAASSLATYAVNPSGQRPVGVLMNDFVNIDQTRQNLNWHKDENIIGGKATLLKKGYVVTNMLQPSITVTKGQTAYLFQSGLLTNAVHAGGGTTATPVVGYFLTTKDQNGYAKVQINL
jgi:hypothetical protein